MPKRKTVTVTIAGVQKLKVFSMLQLGLAWGEDYYWGPYEGSYFTIWKKVRANPNLELWQELSNELIGVLWSKQYEPERLAYMGGLIDEIKVEMPVPGD